MGQRSKPPDRPPAAPSIFDASGPPDWLAMLLAERRPQTPEPEQRRRAKSVDKQITEHARITEHYSEAQHAALPDSPLLVASDRAMAELTAERLPAGERAEYLALFRLATRTPEQDRWMGKRSETYGKTLDEGKLRRRIKEIMREAAAIARTPPDRPAAASGLDDFLDALRRQAVYIHQTQPPQCLAGFMGTPTPYEIVDPVDLLICESGLGLGVFGAAQFSPAALWQEYGDVLIEDHILLVFTTAVTNLEASGLPVALEVRRNPKGADFTSYVKASDGRWYASAHGIRVADGNAYPVAFCPSVVGPFNDTDREAVHATQVVLFHMLRLMRHQAIEYQMGATGAGQRRLNAKMARGQQPVPRPRILDLSKVKIERIPIQQPDPPSAPTGITRRPHDHPGSLRTLRHPKYGDKVGTTIRVRPYKVHGGAVEPRLTIVKLPDAAQPTAQES